MTYRWTDFFITKHTKDTKGTKGRQESARQKRGPQRGNRVGVEKRGNCCQIRLTTFAEALAEAGQADCGRLKPDPTHRLPVPRTMWDPL
jgi:hypothetical protein